MSFKWRSIHKQIQVLHKWLRAVPDLVERQRIAEQFKEAGEVQIEVLVALKDRQKLSALANRLDPHTVEYNKARLALSNSVRSSFRGRVAFREREDVLTLSRS